MAKKKSKSGINNFFDKFAAKVTKATGSSSVFAIALLIVIVWGISGPIFDYSETWQLVINTGTTIITFLMVFVIQKSQNKDSLAIQLKLNELVACNELASNRLIDIEDMTEEEMEIIKKYYCKLGELSKKGQNLHESHSLDEAEENNEVKSKSKKIRQDVISKKASPKETANKKPSGK
ncbi:low affinity iron permease family protein [Flavobacterium album]|uniref:Low affinity iron permease family protein n=1 Tax=Flavobacterium album TaxID=2175091 RepID=A0A2S1QUP1_9FLAO|nr:low affinity iron permease family protein [Flavobacterium album]AWH84093.1 low affinity iron permease family protein [Flavobacterium album]